jgi:hypothetical protein
MIPSSNPYNKFSLKGLISLAICVIDVMQVSIRHVKNSRLAEDSYHIEKVAIFKIFIAYINIATSLDEIGALIETTICTSQYLIHQIKVNVKTPPPWPDLWMLKRDLIKLNALICANADNFMLWALVFSFHSFPVYLVV